MSPRGYRGELTHWTLSVALLVVPTLILLCAPPPICFHMPLCHWASDWIRSKQETSVKDLKKDNFSPSILLCKSKGGKMTAHLKSKVTVLISSDSSLCLQVNGSSICPFKFQGGKETQQNQPCDTAQSLVTFLLPAHTL